MPRTSPRHQAQTDKNGSDCLKKESIIDRFYQSLSGGFNSM
ncbi:hypothetical protein DA2_0679 [Desulfovibrio sp. A2]|nr:hypothetical protein DA2_0679 [Desulfovibrio sp. A2]